MLLLLTHESSLFEKILLSSFEFFIILYVCYFPLILKLVYDKHFLLNCIECFSINEVQNLPNIDTLMLELFSSVKYGTHYKMFSLVTTNGCELE